MIVPSTFEAATVERDRIEHELAEATAAINAFPKGAMGFTPDHIRVLPEWRAAKVRVDKAFKALQNFNVVYVKTFKKELAAQRAQRRSGR